MASKFSSTRQIQGRDVNKDTAQGQAGNEIVLANVNNVMQSQSNGATGKEIVLVNNNVQQGNGVTREEVVSDGATNQQIQTSNMFSVLEDKDGDDAGRNQVVEVENKNNASAVRKLNPTAAVFTPKSTGVGSTTRKEDTEKHKGKKNAIVDDNQRESTAAWVSRAFITNVVATNQSYQEVPSQATEIDATLKNINGACGEVESSDEEIEQEEQSVNNKDKGQQSVGKSNKHNQDQGDRTQSKKDGDGVQMNINIEPPNDVPPDKNKEGQMTAVQQEVRIENTKVVGSASIQSCDVASANDDRQMIQALHKDHDKDNSTSSNFPKRQGIASQQQQQTKRKINKPYDVTNAYRMLTAKFLSISKEFSWMMHMWKQTINHKQRYTLQHTRIQSLLRNSYTHANQKSQKEQKINQKEEEKTVTLKTFYKIHWHSQGNLSSISAVLTGTPTCNSREDKQGRLLSNSSTLRAGQSLMSLTRCGRQDSAGILSGTNQFQSATAGNHEATIREVYKMIDNNRTRRSFREEILDKDGRNDRCRWSEMDTMSVRIGIKEQMWVISELHKNFSGEGKDQVKEQAVVVSSDVVGTAATSTKVLSSGKVLGKHVANHAKQEWMQARKNKYQRDKRGYIIEEIKEKDNNKGKGKMNEDTVVSNNKFGALQVEDEAEQIMQIKDGDVHDQNPKENIKEKVQENNSNTRGTSPNPTDNGIGKGMMYKEGGKVSLNKEDFDARKVKKEAVEMVNKVRESGNISSATRNDAEAKKEQTIDWVHRRFGTSKEELRQCNVTANHCCQEIPSQTYGDSEQKEDINEVNSVRIIWSDEI
ncbi:hypothetical protein A4A49_24370 [Nicotiana attenuata]|uniref:Uncharacterized protein n=1 Tax=Nicotiana attenuata TaxID=49451 RepID=A0A1J6KY37_NICAT|nr:hypothetical protein A4A49_24370 [Nicotiana attenuata]